MVTMLRAVIVGINEYSDRRYREKARLNFARADAEAIRDVLRSSTAFQVDKEAFHLHINEQAISRTARNSLMNVFAQRNFDHNTIALFYFAGHGLYNPKDDLISLCCYDVDFTDPTNQGGIRLNDIYDLLMRSSAECSIAIIDACFSGGLIDPTYLNYITAEQHAKRAIEHLQGPKNIAILAACRSDQTSRESKKFQHGIYTHTLLRGWRDGEARGSDGTVSLFGLVDYVTKQLDTDRQVPQTSIRIGKTITLWQGTPRPPGPPTFQQKPAQSEQADDITFNPGEIKVPRHKQSKFFGS